MVLTVDGNLLYLNTNPPLHDFLGLWCSHVTTLYFISRSVEQSIVQGVRSRPVFSPHLVPHKKIGLWCSHVTTLYFISRSVEQSIVQGVRSRPVFYPHFVPHKKKKFIYGLDRENPVYGLATTLQVRPEKEINRVFWEKNSLRLPLATTVRSGSSHQFLNHRN
jgi:hypothetical protein